MRVRRARALAHRPMPIRTTALAHGTQAVLHVVSTLTLNVRPRGRAVKDHNRLRELLGEGLRSLRPRLEGRSRCPSLGRLQAADRTDSVAKRRTHSRLREALSVSPACTAYRAGQGAKADAPAADEGR